MELSKAEKAPAGAVQVLLDPPEVSGALAQLVERLLCKQDVIGSNPLGSTISRHVTVDTISKRDGFAFARPVGRTPSSGRHFTSFREIIGVVGRARVGVRWSPVLRSWKPNDDVVQVKYN